MWLDEWHLLHSKDRLPLTTKARPPLHISNRRGQMAKSAWKRASRQAAKHPPISNLTDLTGINTCYGMHTGPSYPTCLLSASV